MTLYPTNDGYLKVSNPIHELRPTRLTLKKTWSTKVYQQILRAGIKESKKSI